MNAHGGIRKGAGRPATGKIKKPYGFSFDPKTVTQLETHVPKGKRSQWVEAIILASLP